MTRARGVALVSVLLIVVVATALAYQIANRHSFVVAQSRLTLHGGEVRQIALGAEQFARELLYADWEEEETRNKDTELEAWAQFSQPSPEDAGEPANPDAAKPGPSILAAQRAFDATFSLADGEVALRIDDLAARLNLNALAGEGGEAGDESAANVARLHRLLTHLGLDPALADRWRDWIDANQDVDGLGAEDAEYLLRDPPTRAANRPGIHLSELQFAAGLSPEEMQRLRPYVALLPVAAQRINVNTASAPVLAALAPNFPVVEAEQMLAEPREFDDVEAAVAAHPPLGESVGALAVRSDHFRVQVSVERGQSRAVLTSTLHRDPNTGLVTLLTRSLGEPFERAAPGDEDAGRRQDRQAWGEEPSPTPDAAAKLP